MKKRTEFMIVANTIYTLSDGHDIASRDTRWLTPSSRQRIENVTYHRKITFTRLLFVNCAPVIFISSALTPTDDTPTTLWRWNDKTGKAVETYINPTCSQSAGRLSYYDSNVPFVE